MCVRALCTLMVDVNGCEVWRWSNIWTDDDAHSCKLVLIRMNIHEIPGWWRYEDHVMVAMQVHMGVCILVFRKCLGNGYVLSLAPKAPGESGGSLPNT